MENVRQSPGSPRTPGQGYRTPFRPGRYFSKVKCFSCGRMGHKQAHCPKPDLTLPFRPTGWNMQSDSQQQRNNNSPPGNDVQTGTSPMASYGMYAIHQNFTSSSSFDSTHTSEMFTSHHNNAYVVGNSVLFMDQNVAESTGASIARTADSLTIPDREDTKPEETTQTS